MSQRNISTKESVVTRCVSMYPSALPVGSLDRLVRPDLLTNMLTLAMTMLLMLKMMMMIIVIMTSISITIHSIITHSFNEKQTMLLYMKTHNSGEQESSHWADLVYREMPHLVNRPINKQVILC